MIRNPFTDRRPWILAGIFLAAFLLWTPLGCFAPWVPEKLHQGPWDSSFAFYSLIMLDGSDEGGHYVYLPSLVFDRDLDFSNNWKFNVQAFTATSTGVARNYWTIGAALLWAPFFFLGHGLSYFYARTGHPMELDGYDFPYLTLTGLETVVYAFLGVLCLTRILRRFTSERAAFWIAAISWFSSLVPFYSFIQTKMSHGPEAALVSLFLLTALRAREAPEIAWRWLALGIATGLVAIIRLNGPLILVVAAAVFLGDLLPKEFRTWPSADLWRAARKRLVPWMLGFAPLYAAQALASLTLFGRPFGPSGDPDYSTDNVLSADGFSRLGDLKSLWEMFVGSRYGLLWTMPLWGPAAWGLWQRFKTRAFLSTVTLVYLGLLIAMVLMFGNWGNGFGYRYFAAALPFIAMGLAVFYAQIVTPRGWTRGAIAAGILAVGWQYLQILQHKTWMEHNEPAFTWKAFTNIPEILGEPSLLLRSSAWLPIVLKEGFRCQDLADFHFLVLLPLAMALFLAAACLAWNLLTTPAPTASAGRADRLTPWAWGAGMLCLAPVLWIGLFPPRKPPDLLYAVLVSKIRACERVNGIYDHPLDNLIPRAWTLGRTLGRDQPDMDLRLARQLAEKGAVEKARQLLENVVSRYPDYAEQAKTLLESLPGASR